MPSVAITLDGVDVTANVVFSSAMFESKVNGQPGEAYMRVRDLDSSFSVTEGADWLLAIDGEAAWRGVVTQVVRTYIAPAMNVTESGLQRFIDIRGADLNILFSQRIVADYGTPTNVAGTQFPPATSDLIAIEDLVTNWLDLSSDDIDTSSAVDHVGNLDPAQAARAWSGGWQWGQAMTTIAMLPAAIFYIRPEMGSPRGTLVYCDVDVPDAPFDLSDVPSGPTNRGYREMEIVLDGTSLANDVFCWGMGYGSQVPVFKRIRSTSSVATHGVWQTSRQVTGVYKQATINRIADSIINGSPSSRRGAKEDRPSVRLVTYEPGLLAGHKLTFTSVVWNWTDVIPVRQMAITFESPTAPKYEILLSHEIDSPWSFIDQFWPEIPGLPQPCPDPPCVPCTTCGQQPGACDCGIAAFDDFERTEASGWGNASSGPTWTFAGLGDTSVDGSTGLMVPNDSASANIAVGESISGSSVLTAGPIVLSARFSLDTVPSSNNFSLSIESDDGVDGILSVVPRNDAFGGVYLTTTGIATPTFGAMSFTAGTWYWVEWVWPDSTTGTSEVRIWPEAADRPATAFITRSSFAAAGSPSPFFSVSVQCPNAHSPQGWAIDQIAIGSDACASPNFDDFERSVATGWGVGSPSGRSWSQISQLRMGSPSVTGGEGVASSGWTTSGGSKFPQTIYMQTSMPVSDSFTCTAEFSVDTVLSTSQYQQVLLTFGGVGLSYDIGVQMNISGTTPGSITLAADGTESVAKTDWTTDQYLIEVAWDSGTTAVDLRVWPASDPRPASPTLSTTFTGDLSSSAFAVVNNNVSSSVPVATTTPPTLVLRVASISFGYSGQPCYYDCAEGLGAVDDFERTDTGTLGTATPAGVAWTYSGTGDVTYSVGSGSGQRLYGADTTNVTSTLARLVLPTAYPGGVDVYFEFQASGQPVSGSSLWGDDVAVGGPTGFDVLAITSIPVTYDTVWSVDAQSDGGIGLVPIRTVSPGLASSWWSVKVRRSANYVQAKAWLRDSETEPDWVTVMRASAVDPSTTYIDFGGHGAYSPAAFGSARLAIISAGDAGCQPVTATPSAPPQTPQGFGCEDATRVDSTHYATSTTFQPESTFVWRDGLFQRRGIDYTEGTDHQSVVFSDAVSVSSTIRTCYFTEVQP